MAFTCVVQHHPWKIHPSSCIFFLEHSLEVISKTTEALSDDIVKNCNAMHSWQIIGSVLNTPFRTPMRMVAVLMSGC